MTIFYKNIYLFPRGRGMPRGNLRGGMRGGTPRGGMSRGNAPRGAPAGRGGPPSAAARGGSSGRSRPPASGAQRMLPAAALSHQAGPSGSQPKPEPYDEYVSVKVNKDLFWWPCLLLNVLFFPFRVHMRSLMLSLPTRDMIAITVSSLLQRKSNLRVFHTFFCPWMRFLIS